MSIAPSRGTANKWFEVKFVEEDTSIYLKTELAKTIGPIGSSLLHLFKEAIDQCFECRDFSSTMFSATFAIASQDKALNDVFNTEDLQNPQIFEDLDHCLSFFYPTTVNAVSQKILNQMFNMSLENAQSLLKNQTDEFSFEGILAEKRIEDSVYFSTEEESNRFGQKVNRCLYAYLKAWEEYIKLPELRTIQENSLRNTKLKRLEKELKNCQKDLEKIKKSALGQFNASLKIHDENFLIRRKAIKAAKKIQAYTEAIKKALETSGADMSSASLQYILGPPFIFDYYGILPDKTPKNPYLSFCYVPALQGTCNYDTSSHLYFKTLGFELKAKTLQELEQCIRAVIDLIKTPQAFVQLENEIPPPLFEKNVNHSHPILDHKMEEPLDNAPELINLFKKDPIAQNDPLVLNLLPFSLSTKEALELLQGSDFFILTNMVLILASKELKKIIYFLDEMQARTWFAEHPLEADFSQRKRSPEGLNAASLHDKSKNPRIQKIALRAKKTFTGYVDSILTALRKSGADLSRHDLLKDLIENNYLFSYYGVFPISPDKEFPFIYISGAQGTCTASKKLHLTFNHYRYLLANLGPKDLENEIRSDLTFKKKNNLLPEPRIQNPAITYPSTIELQLLRAMILPKIKTWDMLNKEEQDKTLDTLIKYNQWDRYNIEPKDLALTSTMPNEQSSENFRVEGRLKQKYPFYFNSITCLLIIDNKTYSYPASDQTHRFLKAEYLKK